MRDFTRERARETPLRAAFREHYASLIRFGVVLTGHKEQAEDLVQEAFLRAAGRIPDLRPEEVRPYLRRTVVNLWSNRLRRLALERRHRTQVGSTTPADTDHHLEVWSAVMNLAPRKRACVVLRYYEELSEAGTAEVLGCSVGTVKSQTHKALEHMRRELDDEA